MKSGIKQGEPCAGEAMMMRGPGLEQYNGPAMQQDGGYTDGFQGQVTKQSTPVLLLGPKPLSPSNFQAR